VNRVGSLILKNSAANIVRGSATALVALALPYFLTHTLEPSRFAAWSLMLQIAAYAGYLDFGLQTAIARFIAQATEMQEWVRRDRLIATALNFLIFAACLAAVVIGIVIWNIPSLFPGIPPLMTRELTQACCIVTLASCLLLPLSTYTGILIGLHRNELPALAIGGSRLLGALAVIVASRYTHSLVVLGTCIAIANFAGGIIQLVIVRRLLPDISFNPTHASQKLAHELLHYCLGLTIYAVGMLLVSGLDVTIVGHFRFREVGAYSIAGMLVTFFAGLNTSVISALITPIAALHSRNEHQRIRDLVIQVTRLNVFVNSLFVVMVYLVGYSILRLWVGSGYADQSIRILKLLSLAQAIRLIGGVYSAMLIATGQQNKGIQNGIAESVSNVIASLVGGALYGGIGVAWGTLIGAVIGTSWVLLYTMPSAREILFSS
jgi:O-antigen/teichoic acid export membrane protein